MPIIAQSLSRGGKRSIGPMRPKVSESKPDREADAETGANQAAAPPHLQREINGGEPADQTAHEQRRIDFSEEHAAPKTDEDGGVKSVISPEQNTQDQRRESVGRDQASAVSGLRKRKVPLLQSTRTSFVIAASWKKMIPKTRNSRELCRKVFG